MRRLGWTQGVLFQNNCTIIVGLGHYIYIFELKILKNTSYWSSFETIFFSFET